MPEIICDVVEQSTLSGLPFSGEDDDFFLRVLWGGHTSGTSGVCVCVCPPNPGCQSPPGLLFLYNVFIILLHFYYSMFSVWDPGTTQIIPIQG